MARISAGETWWSTKRVLKQNAAAAVAVLAAGAEEEGDAGVTEAGAEIVATAVIAAIVGNQALPVGVSRASYPLRPDDPFQRILSSRSARREDWRAGRPF